jgi:hypothetical protein
MAVEVAGVAERGLARKGAGVTIHTFMVALFVATALAGFAPRSVSILSGTMPMPPLAVHLHAFVMTAWLVLLAAQAGLVAAGKQQAHRTLGIVSFVLAPALLAGLIGVTIVRYYDLTEAAFGTLASNILFLQLRSIILFPLFFVWAMAVRRTDLETHKRSLILATFVLLDAAVARHVWLPGNDVTVSYDPAQAYWLLLLVPALVYDTLRLGRPHRAYVVGLALLMPFVIATHFIWNSPQWHAIAAKWMGVLG